MSTAGGTTPGASSGAACEPDVAATVTLPTTGAAGATIPGSFNYINNGPSDAQGVGVTASLTPGLGTVTFTTPTLNGVALSGVTETYNNTTGVITVSGLPTTLPNGQTLALPFSFTMPANGTSVTGTNSVTESGLDPVPSNNNGTATVNGTAIDDDAVTITGLPASAAPSTAIFGVLNYLNNGPSSSLTTTYNAKLPVGAAVSSIKYNGTTLAGASATVGADGTVTFTGLPATLNSGDTVTVAFNASMPANGSSVAATANISSSTTDSNTSNNSAAVVVTGSGSADLATSITGLPTSGQAAGTPISGSVKFQNNGPNAAQTPTYTVQVPPGSTISASQVLYNGTPINGVTVTIDQYGNVTFGGTGLPTTLNSGDSVTIGFSSTMPADGSNANAVSSISSPTADPNLNNNNATATTPGISEADLQSTVTGYATFAQTAGTVENGTITFANNGPSSGTGVSYTTTTATGLTGVTLGTPTLNGVAVPGATATYNATTGAITYSGLPTTLASGDKITVTMQFTMPGTPVTVSTNIQGNTADPVPANNAASVTIAGGNDLSVALTNFAGTAQATGATENGTITFSNLRGTSTTATSYTPVLNLTAGLGAITLTASGTATNAAAATATYNTATGAVTFANLPVLAAGQTLIFTLGNFVMPANNVVVSSSISESPNIDTYLPNNSATTTIQNTTAAQADMATTITGLGGVAAAGSTVSSGVLHFTNLTAATAATATSFAATLPVGATVTSITLNGTAIPGASATVAANGTVTFTGMPTTVAGSGAVAVSFSFPMPANGSAATATATVTSSNDSVTTNNTATATETGDAATDLQTIITEPASAAPSASITGQVRYLNNGPNSAVNPTYQLTLPVAGGTPAITSVMLNGSLLSVTTSIAANGVVTFSGLPTTLNSGDDLMVNFTAKMPANGNSISTTGQITYPGTDTVPANNAATATTTGNPNAPTVMVTKTVDHTTHNMGDQVTWTLTVNNTGTSATTGVITLTDQLPNNIGNVVVTPNGATCSPSSPTAGTTLTCSVPAGLAASNGTASVTISATLLAAGTYNNSVVPSGNSTDNPTCMANACSTVTVVGSATVQVLKDSINGTGSFGYALTNLSATSDNITTQNQNTSTPGVINVVTSLTTAVTINENSVPTGFALTSASCVDTNASADGNVTTAFGTLSGTTLTIPTADIKQNAVIQCTFVNTATESIKIAKTGPTAMVTGTAYNYVLTVSNTSASATITTAQVKDQLPANFTFNSASGLNWTCSAAGQLITCSFGGASIGPGGNSTITVSATPTATAANVINYATVDGTGGTNAAAPAGCTASNTCALSPAANVTAAGGLTIAKSAPVPGLMPGANSTYTLTVTNNGATAATSATVKDQLPTSALTFVSAVGTNWTCSNASGLITCTFAGSIAAGGTSTIAVTVKPMSNAVVGTSVTNYASIDPTGGTAPPTPGASCTPTNACASNVATVAGPNVMVTKTVDQANHSVGDTITWTIKAANTGASATSGAVTLSDTLPSNIGAPITVTPSAGTTCSTTTPAAGTTFTCTVPAGLAATTGVATATITAIANATGTVSNTVVPSGTDNPTCGSGACTASTQVAGQSLTLSKALTGNRVASGDQFTVEIMAGTSTVSSATTTGSGNTVSNGSTGETPVTAGTAYTLTEVAAGTTSLAQYSSALACTNATTGSTTTLPTTVGGTVTPAAGDRISCTITNAARPVLNLAKALASARVHNTDQFTLQIANGATIVGTATTTGTGSALATNSTGVTTLVAGTTYTLGEIASGGTQLAQYTSALACANATTGSATVLPTTVPGNLTPAAGDNISCTLTNTAKPPVVTYLATLTGNRAANTDQFTLGIADGATTVDTVTTTGTGNTLTNNTTGPQTLVSGDTYSLTEVAAGTTNLAEYTSTLSCTNTDTSSTTTLPTTLPAALTPMVGDNITCTVSIVPKAPTLTLAKALGSNREAANDQFTLQINSGATAVASTTTTGTGNTVANGSVGPTALTSGTTYTLTEVAAGGANLALYTKTLACTNTLAGSTTVLPTSVPGNITPQDGDAISCTLTNTGNAELATTKTLLTVNGAAPTGTVKPGDVLVYQLAIQNTGASAGTTTLGETVPLEATYSGAGAEGWGGTCAAAGSTCSQSVTVAAVTTVDKTFTVTVAANATGASITNTATSSSGTCTTCTVTTPIAAELTTTKTLLTVNGAAPGASVKPGDVLVYQLAIQNTGGTSGVTTLGETVPAETTYSGVAGEGWGGTCAAAGSTCSQAVTVAAASTVDKTFTVTVAANATGASIINTATSSLGTCSATCRVTTPIAAELVTTKTLLTVNGAAPGATVKPGDVLVYQLAVVNNGGSSGTTTLGETVPANTAYSGAGAEGWGGTCAAAGSTCSQAVTVAAAATLNKTFTVTIAAGATGASIVNTASSSVGTCTSTCSVTTPIAAELVTTKTLLTVNGAAPGASVKAGDVLVYQLAVVNNGGTSGTTTLGETVPAATAYSGAAGEGWGGTCAAAGTTCSQAVTVAAAATVNKTFTVTVAAAATGASIVNTASTSLGTCTATCSVTTPLAAGVLATTKTLLTVNGAAPTATVKPGDVLVYQLAVQNTGGSAATTALGETVPVATTYSGAGAEGWGGTCAAAGTTCTQSVTVNAGATLDKTFTVTIAAGATGNSIVNTATSSVGSCTTCSVTTPIAGELVTTKTLLTVNGAAPGATVKPGDVLVYQLAVQNNGGSSGTTTLGETVPVNTAYSGAGAEGWGGTCAAAGSTCSQTVTVAAAATVDKTFTVTVAAGATGASIINTATTSVGTCAATCSVTTPIAAELVTTKTLLSVNGAAPGANVKSGDVLVYQLAVKNNGGSAGTTTLGETVPTASTYSGAGAEGWGGTCAAAGTTCSQSVTVAASATVDKTFTVTVAAGAGGGSIVNTASSSVGTCTATCSVTTPIAAQLVTTKTLLSVNGAAPGATVKPGDVLVYQLAVQNNGGSSGTTTLGETVPVNTTYSGVAGEGWGGTCAAAGTTCSQAVTVAAAASVNKTFTVTVAAAASGASIVNTASSSVGTCSATCSVSTPIAAQLVTTKTLLSVNGGAPGATVKPGDVLVYQLAVQNAGGASGTTTLGETVPVNTTYSGAAGEGWGGACAAAGSSCSQAVTVAATSTVNKTFTVTIAAGATGASIVNTASSSVGTCSASCAVTTPIAAELATTKTLLSVNGAAPSGSVKPGDVLVYQLAVQNTGGAAGTTTVGETVPVGTAYSGAGAEGWGGTCAAAGTTCSQAVTIAAATTVDKTFTVTVAAGATGASISNTATSSLGSCTSCTVATPLAAEIVTTKTLLSVNGAAPSATVKPGDVLVYQLAVQNTGGTAGSTTLGETVPVNTSYSGAGAEGWGGTCIAAGSTCSQAVAVPATTTVNKTFTVTIAAGASGASIVNTASSSVGTCSATCSVSTPIAAELATTKTLLTVNGAAPTGSVKPGDVLVYQLAIKNNGGAAGTTTLGETVPAGTSYTGAAGEGWGGTCAAAGTTCSQAVTAAAGATVDKTFTVTVAAGASGASIVNTATTSVGTCTTCSVTTPIAAELTTTKTLLSVNGAAPTATVKPGDVLVYQLAVQNTGGASGTTTLGETVPTGTSYTGAAGEGWGGTCAAAGSTCAQAVTVAAAGTVNKTFTVTLGAGAAGASIVNTATSSVGTCSASCSVTTPIVAELSTTKTLLTVNGAAPGASVKAGDVLVYQLAVVNSGGTAGSTTLGEAVPLNTAYSGVAGEGWGGTCAAAASTCTQAVTVPATTTINKTFTVTVAAGVSGTSIINTATSSNGSCTTCSVTTPVTAGSLATTKTLLTVNGAAPGASVKEGDVLVYQLAVKNNGGSAATTSLGETVPANTSYSGAAGEGWGGTCAAASSTCAQSVAVNAGQTVDKTFTVTVAAGVAAASISNTATSSAGTCATCTVTTPVAGAVLNAVKTLLTVNGAAATAGATVKGGDVLVYQIAVTNSGGSAATTSLLETVPAGTTYTGAAEGWSAGCAAPGSTCTQSVTVNGGAAPVDKTFTVTVTSPTGANTTIMNVVTSSLGTCSACTVNDPVAQADVLTTLTFPNSALPNTAVSGTIVFSNSGPSTALGLTYTASLSPGLGTPTFVLPAGVTANYSNTTGTVTFAGLPTTLASGANAGTITVNFTQPASGATTVVMAGIATTTNDPVPGNNNRTANVTGTAQADLTSTLNVPNTVNAGGTVTGTVAYGNLGPSPAATPSYFLTLSPGLGTVSFSNLPPGVIASYDSGTGNVTFTNLPATLNSGASVPAITFSYVQPATGMSSVTSNITSPTPDPVPSNNMHTDPVGGVQEADTSAKLAFPGNVNAGATVAGTLIYANLGPSPAATVTYTLTLASGLANVAFPNLPAGFTANYNPTTGVVTLGGLPASLPSGTTEPTINISYTQPASGSSTVAATIASSTADPDLTNNSPTVTVSGNPEADSSVTLNFPTNVAGLQPVSGTVTFANAGPSIANGETYTLMLTPGLAGVSFANLPTGVTASYATATGVVTLTGMPTSVGVNSSVGPITVNYTQPASGVSAVMATVTSTTQDPNTGNNSATANVVGTASTADLAIQTSAPATVAPDGSLIYTLTITNNGPGAANNATFTDTLPSVLGVPTASCAPASGGVTCGTTTVSGKTVSGTLTSLPSGGTAVVTITTTAPASGTFTDTATVAAPTGITDPVLANNTSSVTTTVGAVPNNVDLSVTASGTTSVQPNGTVSYVVDVVNGGPSAANNAVFNYTTAAPVTNVTWTCVAVGGGALCPAASGTGNTINQTIATFPDGGHLEYTITGKAPAAPQQFVDTATITAPAGVTETNTANNTANTTTNVQNGVAPSADLATTINGPSTVQPGAPVTYMVVVTDNGPAAGNGSTLAVPVASQVTNVTTTCVASGGAVCPTVAAGNNINTVIPTLPAGGQLTFTVTGTAPQSGTFDTSATVTPPTGTNDPVPSNNTAGPVVTTVPNLTADLSIQKNGPAQVLANGIVNYTITVSNAGPNSADGASITDNLPAGLTNVTAVCSNPSGGATCGPATVTGTTMNAGAQTLPAAGSITITVSGKAPASGTLSNSASVSPPTGVTDPNPGNNTAGPVNTTVVSSVPTQADLSATLTGPSTVAPNGLVTYTLTITNAGPAAGDGAPVTDVLPAVLTNPHATCGNALGGAICGPVTITGNSIASAIAALPVGAALTFTITATAPASGTFTNSASVGAAPNTTDPNTSNNVGGPVVTTIGAITGTANLGISKTGPSMAGAGADFSYTIIVSNAGPGAANGALLSDPVPAGLTNVRATCANPTNGAVCGPVVVTGQNVTSNVTLLPALGTVTLTITVTAPVPTGLNPMSFVNRATITPPPGINDPDSSDNVSGAVETSIVAAGVSGEVWLDLNHDRKDDAGDPPLPNWIVELFHNGVLVASTTTNLQGQYSFSGVAPGPGYSIDFRDPGSKAVYGTPTNGDQGTPNPDSDAVIGNGIIQSLTLKPGINIVQQSLPVDPSGVVYDAVSRTPIGGATVTLVGPAGFNPATQLVGGAANDTQVTGGVGLTAGDYQFLLINPGGAGGAPAGTYTIVVTPPAGYLVPPAKGGGVELPQGTFTVPGPLNNTTAIQPNARPPKVGLNGPNTVYYFNLTFNPGSGSVINNHIPLDRIAGGALSVTKTGNTTTADIGETVLYTIDVTSTVGLLPNVTVTDTLPRGFTYISGTATVNGAKSADPKGASNGGLVFTLGTVATGVTDEIKYRVRVGVGAQQGDGVNRAQAQDPLGATSNVATFKVNVNGGVFTTNACVVGKVFIDCNGNQIQDENEIGIPGVRLYFSDGTFVVTDSEGKYSYCGLRPTTHTLKIDKSTMPAGSVMVESSNRNALDPNSLFIDLKNGEMHQADFIEGSCSASVMDQVKARRGQGEVNASHPSEKAPPGLMFDSRPLIMTPAPDKSPAAGVSK